MTRKRIFVTGASGCIGHYLVEALIQQTQHELFLLVRNPQKLQIDVQARPGITILSADLRSIGQYRDLLPTIEVAILAATAWGGEDVEEINITRNLELLTLLNPEVCQQVLYFSTASILNRQNQLLPEAGTIGSDYIRSKYVCFQKIAALPIGDRVTTLFPTLVLGGGERYPYSHLCAGIGDVVKWIPLIRFLDAEGSFHFIHGQDIAQVVAHLVDHPLAPEADRTLVLGNAAVTVNQTIAQFCTYLNQKISFRIPLSLKLADFLIAVFRIQMGEWERFSLHYRHFTYQNPVSPTTFGLPTYCPTLYDVLKLYYPR